MTLDRKLAAPAHPAAGRSLATAHTLEVRTLTRRLAAPLSAEDCSAQSMADASPVKWHLAHTTWFFETFLLCRFVAGYRVFDEHYGRLFNSYYEALGARHPRPQRGLLTRPSLEDVLRYRAHVDAALIDWLPKAAPEAIDLLELGLHHERQHQELLLTDVKHLLFQNPLKPAYRPELPAPRVTQAQPLRWHAVAEGRVDIGANIGADMGQAGFAFDNEGPRHTTWLAAHAIADRPVNNAEFRHFIEDGGYRRPELWLTDGWQLAEQRGWQRPLYWDEDLRGSFTLAGARPLIDSAPVCHVSHYEADAYARWAGARLPTEAEWEATAAALPVSGNFVDSDLLQPCTQEFPRLRQFFGDVWEWTASSYLPYPGFRIAAGAIGEYNGKFMANQMVLRGGSCVSHADHLRASYRNFFYPDARWQFSGIRLARDGG